MTITWNRALCPWLALVQGTVSSLSPGSVGNVDFPASLGGTCSVNSALLAVFRDRSNQGVGVEYCLRISGAYWGDKRGKELYFSEVS